MTQAIRIFQVAKPEEASARRQEELIAKAKSGFSSSSNGADLWGAGIFRLSSVRTARYKNYEAMDVGDVSRALDIIARQMSAVSETTQLPVQLDFDIDGSDDIFARDMSTLQATLREFIRVLKLKTQLFSICRNTIKYGDCFFVKSENGRTWHYITPDVVKDVATDVDGTTLMYRVNITDPRLLKKLNMTNGDCELSADRIVHFSNRQTLSNDAFGTSVLDSAYQDFIKLTLLEQAVLIFRITRAPERLIHYIDISGMQAHQVGPYMKRSKEAITQTPRVSMLDGVKNGMSLDTMYNPTATTNEYFIPVKGGNAAGSRIESLPAQQWEVPEVKYFQQKLFRTLQVPVTYMLGQSDEGGQVNDGKVGTMYQEELRFEGFVRSLQEHINEELTKQFQNFIADTAVDGFVDISVKEYVVRCSPPSNFIKYKQLAMMGEALGNYQQVKDDPLISNKFKLKYILQLDESLIQENENMLIQERGIDQSGDNMGALRQIYDTQYVSARKQLNVKGKPQAAE